MDDGEDLTSRMGSHGAKNRITRCGGQNGEPRCLDNFLPEKKTGFVEWKEQVSQKTYFAFWKAPGREGTPCCPGKEWEGHTGAFGALVNEQEKMKVLTLTTFHSVK